MEGKVCLWRVYCFHVVCPAVTFCFPYNILTSLLEFQQTANIFIYTRQILLTKSKGKGPILLELFPFVVLNGFLYRGLCLCYYSPYTGRSTPTTAFDEQFDTFPIQCRHIEHMHEGVWLIFFFFFDKMTALRT